MPTNFLRRSARLFQRFFAFAVILLLASCRKDELVTPPPAPQPTIYVGGSVNSQATYWKDGKPVTVPHSTAITSIVPYGNDLYMAGPSENAGLYWKNGTAIPVPGALEVDYLAVSGTNVYAAGLDKQVNLAAWTNGVETNLSRSLPNVAYTYGVTGIAVTTSSVYVTGSIYFTGTPGDPTDVGNRAVYWKDGQLTYLTHDGFGGVYYPSTSGIAASGADTYAAGNINIDADTLAWCGYWKNGARVTLLNRSRSGYATANAITLAGGSVYVVGTLVSGSGAQASGPSMLQAVYWKDGQMNLLPGGTEARALAISGKDLYILGTDTMGNAVVWKNGKQVLNLGQVKADCLALE